MAYFSDLVGKTLTSIKQKEDELIFIVDDGTQYIMHHYQDCCEDVSIDDINGDLNDLIGTPILLAKEVSNEDFEKAFESRFKRRNPNDYWEVDEFGDSKPESYTWTFYKIATVKGYVDIRWFGQSNGFYSESVSFSQLSDDEKISIV